MSDLAKMGFRHVRAYDRFIADEDMLNRIAKGNLPWVDERGRQALVEYYEWFVESLDQELEPGKYTHLAIDTVEPIEAAFVAAVESGRRSFGWGGSRAFGKLEVEGVRPLYENLLEAISQRGVETIILTSHLGPVWIDDEPVPGKIKPKGRLKLLARLSTAMLWLLAGDDPSGAPAAAVLKARIGKVEATDDDRWQIRRVLPERLPRATWEAIGDYIDEPADLEHPKPGETLSPDERKLITDNFFTDKQMELMIARMGGQAERPSSQPSLVIKRKTTSVIDEQDDDELKEVAVAMIRDGHSNRKVAAETGLPIPKVVLLRKKIASEIEIDEGAGESEDDHG